MGKNSPELKRANKCCNANAHSCLLAQRNDSPRFPTFIQQTRDEHEQHSEQNQLLEESNPIGDSIYVQGCSRAVSVTSTGEKLFIEPDKDLVLTLRDEVFCTKVSRRAVDTKPKACATKPEDPAKRKELKNGPKKSERKHLRKLSVRSDHRNRTFRKRNSHGIPGRVRNTEDFNHYSYQTPNRPSLPDNQLQSWALTKCVNATTQTSPETFHIPDSLLLQAMAVTPGTLVHYRNPPENDSDENGQSWCGTVLQAISSILTVITLILAIILVSYQLQLPHYLRIWYMGPDVKPKTKLEILKELFLLLIDW